MSGDLLLSNLLSPMVLAFGLGAVATVLKSDLRLPPGLYTALSTYLLFAIGLKGGVALSEASVAELWLPAIATVLLGLLTALLSFVVGLKLGRLDRIDAAAMAAHYGSVSAVTFIAAQSFAQAQKIQTEGYLPALVALLEIPAILLALVLAGNRTRDSKFGELVHELLTGKTVILLLGGIVIGALSAREGFEQVKPMFGDLFKGALTIFLLEMGLLAAQQIKALGRQWVFLTLFGIGVPLLNGTLGVLAGSLVGMSAGGSGILGAMAASASYIAAPAAVRVALPTANVSVPLATALAITFPFNLLIGIPLFMQLANLWGA